MEDAIKLGGLAMPSIAITKANMGHNKFGDISLIFDKDTINPKSNKKNYVYSTDAYTPTFPQIDYESNYDTESRIRKLYYDLYDTWGEQVRPLYRYAENLQDELNRWNGESGIIDNLKNDTSMMQVFHIIKDGKPINNVVKKTEESLTDAQVENAKKVISELNLTKENIKGIMPHAFVKENESKLREIAYKLFVEDNFSEKDAREVADAMSLAELNSYLLRPARQYLKQGKTFIKEEVDYTATAKKIKSKTNGALYQQWLKELFDGATKSKGLRNNVDTLYADGRRRTFKQTHYEVSLTNIVKAMTQGELTGIAAFGSSAYGALAQTYNSINEIKENSDRLLMLDDDEYVNLKKLAQGKFRDIAEQLANNSEGVYDCESMLAEAISRYGTNKERVAAYIKREGHGWTTYKESLVDDLINVVNEVRSMPTGYFEAKPRRAVMFDEVKAAIVPNNTSKELIDKLKENGVEVVKYKSGDEEDRLNKLNKVSEIKGLKFSKSIDQRYLELAKNPEVNREELQSYDDNCNIIPLSERFNSSKNDIRYSKATVPTELAEESKLLKEKLIEISKLTRENVQLRKFISDYGEVRREIPMSSVIPLWIMTNHFVTSTSTKLSTP